MNLGIEEEPVPDLDNLEGGRVKFGDIPSLKEMETSNSGSYLPHAKDKAKQLEIIMNNAANQKTLQTLMKA